MRRVSHGSRFCAAVRSHVPSAIVGVQASQNRASNANRCRRKFVSALVAMMEFRLVARAFASMLHGRCRIFSVTNFVEHAKCTAI